MNTCTHTGQACEHAALCTLNTDDGRGDACANLVEVAKSNKEGCGACANVGTDCCRFTCFRTVMDHIRANGVRQDDGDKVRAYVARQAYERMTPYQKMRHDGTLAAQRRATAARRIAEAATIAVDNEADVSLQCAASAIAGGEA